jgi:quercetin dioxygenase-like cupin family protein
MAIAAELFLAPHQGTQLQVMQDTLRILSRGDQTNAAYEMFELTGPLNSGSPPHFHPWSETYYILEGTVEVLVGKETVQAVPGSSVTIPSNMVHTYRIASDTARFLVTTSTTAASRFFQDLHQASSQGACRLDDAIAIASRHQVTLSIPLGTGN